MHAGSNEIAIDIEICIVAIVLTFELPHAIHHDSAVQACVAGDRTERMIE